MGKNCPRCYSSNTEILKNGVLVCNKCGFDTEEYEYDILFGKLDMEDEVTDSEHEVIDEFNNLKDKLISNEQDE